MMLQTFSAKLRRLFKIVYPWANTAFEVWLLVCNVAYLFDKTPFYRPWLRWVGADIRRLGVEDMVSPCVTLGRVPSDEDPARGTTSISSEGVASKALAGASSDIAAALAVFSSAVAG